MPPRSYYHSPRHSDYLAYFTAYFPNELQVCRAFLEATNYPYIGNIHHLAAYIGVSSALLKKIISNVNYHYSDFTIPKGGGKERVIYSPKTYLKVIQWWICDNIFSNLKFNESVYGFVKGRNYIDNAKKHFGRKYILNVDVKNFFDSISTEDVKKIFLKLGYPISSSEILSKLCTLDNRLPTGAPTSPVIANLYFKDIDNILELESIKNGWIYTRYADDLTFSANTKINFDFLETLKNVLDEYHLKLNDKKTKFMGPGSRQEITGIVVNSVIGMPKYWRNKTRGFLHNVRKDPSNNLDKIQEVKGLYGVLIYLDPEKNRSITKQAYEVLGILKSHKKPLHETKHK
ncbi:reverse transcriptase family protein [Pseudochrobactrum sp. Wa41.01b-1]|uniref:reverse transcriptase family protein n=1 Tax=Pseudochrobactrum sp. Wa41.01b-1 TaxID=2864102 RepID=UPI001C68CDCE|nr:reverse transcriptase family protein [Pseudochrobactrum sp. Wa41.01b-1]QYM74138.1 reverse transcriptase family protein [Pseudochrobactrum sp. Wa41.01b-1]